MLATSELDYKLPARLIARHPVSPRDAARLLVTDRGVPARMSDRSMGELPELLRAGDLLVFNTTRVLPARFHGEREGTGGRMEGLYLREAETERRRDAETEAGPEWVCLIKGRHTRAGAVVGVFTREGSPSGVRLTVTGRPEDEDGAWTVHVSGHGGATTAEVLERIGSTPLPPYILRARREAHERVDDARDRETYQTVYAAGDGASVAAPTAGLHFTPDLLARLAERGVGRADVVLHVGAGTFKPVETEFVEQHPMHAEWCTMTRDTIDAVRRTRAAGGRVIAVGTTAARTLESYAAIVDEGGEAPAVLKTRLLITPGRRFRWTDGLLTNFHLPRSTLLALVAAFLGEDGVRSVRRMYAHAIDAGYRFYSFGDACLIV